MKRYIFLILIYSIMFFSCTENPRVVIVTNLGEIEIELNAKDAPKHTENFIKIDARQRPNRRVVMERVYED